MNRKKIKFLVSSGPTRERIDAVRFISNRSSGRMGNAIAEAAREAGCDVTLVSGPVSIAPPEGVEVVGVESAADMAREIRARASGADVVVMAAAVADFRPVRLVEGKLKKDSVEGPLTLELERTEDILESLGGERGADGPLLVGFAAEMERLEENASEKLRRKNLDWIVANDVSGNEGGFASERNAAIMLSRDGNRMEFPLMVKRELAKRVVDAILLDIRR